MWNWTRFAQDRSATRGKGWDVKSEASMCSPNCQQRGLLAMTIHSQSEAATPGPHRSFEVWALKYEGFMICNGRRIDAFELWCWRRLLRVPWTARRSNQFILKEINPANSLEGLTLKLKLWSFGHLMQRPWCWERLKVGGEGSDRGWDGWMASPTRWAWVDG